MTLKITSVRVTTLDFGPYKKPFRNSIVTSRSRGASVVEVETDEGLVGISHGGNKSLVEGRLAGILVGRDPFYIEALWDDMFRANRKPTVDPALLSSIGAVDIALWDLLGKAVEMPAYKLLGAYRDRIPAYAAGGYYEDGKGIDELVDEMTRYVAAGYSAVKMKVGGASLREDVERVKAVREALPDNAQLMIDANNAWNPYEAIRFGRAVEDLGIYWFEEPVAPDDVQGTAAVKAAVNIPVAVGENIFTRLQCRDFITSRAVDILQADVLLSGGYTEWRKIAGMAGAYHIPMSPHGNPNVTAHVVASVPNTVIIETYPEAFAPPAPIFTPLAVKDGHIVLPDRPGLGVDLNRDVVAKYKVG